MRIRGLYWVFAFCFFFLPLSSQAEGSGMQIGASVGFSKSINFCDDSDENFSSNDDLDCKDGVLGFKLDVARTFYEELEVHIGAELAFIASGEFSREDRSNDFIRQSSIGFGGFLVGTYPVTDVILLQGKLGVFYWNTTLKDDARSSSNRDDDDDKFSTVGLGLGAAAQFRTADKISFRAEWSYFSIGNRGDSTEDDSRRRDDDLEAEPFHLFSVGVLFSF